MSEPAWNCMATEAPKTAVSREALSGTACWSCGDQRAAQFCGACGKVQPPMPVDYFAFFGLPRKLDLDMARLERDFYDLSRKLHPDLYARADSREREWSLEQSSHLNDAYRVLRDPIRRTEYLLKLEGVELEEQSKIASEEARAKGELKQQVIPPAMLEEIFELNMQLEEARMNKKMGESDPELTKELEQQKAKLEHQFDELMSELKGYWHEWDKLVGASAEHAIPEMKCAVVRDKMVDLLNRRNYIRNLVRTVEEVLETGS